MSVERVLPLYANSEEPSEHFYVWTEDRQDAGWVMLAREAQCPGGCVGGEVLWGSDLHACRVCGGHGVVSVGVGGAFLYMSRPQAVPDEPDLVDYWNEMRHFIPADAVSGTPADSDA